MMDWIDGIKDALNGAGNIAKDTLAIWKDYASTDLELTEQKAAIDIAKTQADTQKQMQALQAQYQLKIAQQQLANASIWDANGLATSMGNMQRLVAGNGGQNSIMLYLTVAGLALAWLTYVKR